MLASAVMLSTSACAGPDESTQTLTVGFVVDPSWAQVPVADRAGYFSRHGITVKVVNFPSGVEALQALAARQVDVTTAADVPTAATLTRSASLRIVADGSRWAGSRIVAWRGTGIATVNDLAGRRIGTPLGTSAAYFAADTLSHNRINATLVQVAPQAMVTAATQRNVDAVSIFQPYQAQVVAALGDDAVVLGGGSYTQHSLYLATDTAVAKKSPALSSFFAALKDASADLEAQSPDAVAAVSAATQLGPALLTTVLSEFDFTVRQPQADLAATLTTLGRWEKDQGAIGPTTQLPDYATLTDNSFVKP
ncbi:ABC transporter substrate-binding protein [Pseudonocardia acaciae]|uniref:ABC transporter substrate-binding protein n=1 Tax=Pseudonocardia acaciae TaxID=551276 RepID=UPI001B8033E0|nr:ABC transporter substrate-binding protein [Pseudonocardia acaciae]